METLIEMLSSRVEHLLGRAGGPLHFRLLIMPLVVTFFAIRAGMKDAREGQPSFVRTLLGHPAERPRLIRSALKDVGRIIIVAVVLDTTYQLLVLRTFHPGELLLVVVATAILPYFVIRGPVSLLMRRIYTRQSPPANPNAAPKDRMSGKSNTDH